jgi:hypothetical protein
VRTSAVVLGASLLLAGLDFVAALLAAQWSRTHDVRTFLLGAAVEVVLFGVYALVLQIADLTVVTLGWIVVLQVGLVLLDRYRYGVHLSGGQWAAVVAILALQGYLVVSSDIGADAGRVAPAPAASGEDAAQPLQEVLGRRGQADPHPALTDLSERRAGGDGDAALDDHPQRPRGDVPLALPADVDPQVEGPVRA